MVSCAGAANDRPRCDRCSWSSPILHPLLHRSACSAAGPVSSHEPRALGPDGYTRHPAAANLSATAVRPSSYASGGKSEGLNPDSPSSVPLGSNAEYDDVIHGSAELRLNSRCPIAADWCAAKRKRGSATWATCGKSLNGSSAILRNGAVNLPPSWSAIRWSRTSCASASASGESRARDTVSRKRTRRVRTSGGMLVEATDRCQGLSDFAKKTR